MELIDSHCHIDVAEFDADRAAVLAHCRDLGVTRMVVPAVDLRGWPGLIALCRNEAGLYPALGLHPIYLQQHGDDGVQQLEQQLAITPEVVAIGEIGLDYFVTELDRQQQQILFEAQLTIARDAGLPVLLHIRKAYDQVLATLRRIRVKGGIAHAFNGSLEQARQFIELGFKLGFGGTLTFDRANNIRRLARELPLETIVLETDAPDMAGAAHRGQRNSPEYLPEYLQVLAVLRGENADSVARQTTLNTCQVLSLR
jgi:TatD DNase family protein